MFFDIDGTLFSEKLRQVPQSAVLALKKTMEKGNLTFINTGRTLCQTSKIREEAPVNGAALRLWYLYFRGWKDTL
ncbi:MAG: HAD hydrolase family protein [Clostridium fessum]